LLCNPKKNDKKISMVICQWRMMRYYGSMMRYSSQTPPFNGYMPMENENFPCVGAFEFPEFSTQITPSGMAVANEVTPNLEDSWIYLMQ